MANIIMIHGAYGNPDENWFPWLKEELEKIGHKVFIPKFPTPEDQTLDSWLKAFKPYEQYLDKDTVLIGHSLGAAFILTLLETRKAKAVFFVAGFIGDLDNPKFDVINKTFTEKEFDWQVIRQNCSNFSIYHSNNDPYVPIKKAEELSSSLGQEYMLVLDAGHFNKDSGYDEIGFLLHDLKKNL